MEETSKQKEIKPINPAWKKIITIILTIGVALVGFFILFGEAFYLKSLYDVGIKINALRIVITILITLSLMILTFVFGLKFIRKVRG